MKIIEEPLTDENLQSEACRQFCRLRNNFGRSHDCNEPRKKLFEIFEIRVEASLGFEETNILHLISFCTFG